VRARTAVVLAALVGVVAAAVAVPLLAGGDSRPRLTKAAYAHRVTTIFAAVGASFHDSRPGGTNAQTSASLRAMKTALDRAATALAKLRPPRDAGRDHAALVAATRDYAAQVDLLRASVDFGDSATIATHLHDVTAPRTIRRALADLAVKGYRIPVTVASPR
jgi:hypothetical protein